MPERGPTGIRRTRRACFAATLVLGASCGFDRSDRFLYSEGAASTCVDGSIRCTSALERCERLAVDTLETEWRILDDCGARGEVCVLTLETCAPCSPGDRSCEGQSVMHCKADGSGYGAVEECDTALGYACRVGACEHLCGSAATQRSNVGCEYWAVDLDNAMIDDSLNAAAQQFAVVVSNPQPDVAARVVIERDDSAPRSQSNGAVVASPNESFAVASADIPPLSLRVFKLGPREVDGSPDGEYDTGTHTALTRHAYRLKSDVPVVAYQFNPLENVAVFSNDASLLKPVEALTYTPGELSVAYVAVGWPQTIASTDDPDTNFSAANPIDLRAFLTLVGTREGTHIRVTTSTRVIGGGPIPETDEGGIIHATLDAFDVLNLETDDFNADFTGTIIEADQPVVVFSGGEASDAPFFQKLADRRCCADHLEEQLDPVRTAGRAFVAARGARRTEAVANAGAVIGLVEEPEYYRVVAVTDEGARFTTTLGGSQESFVLANRGDHADIETTRDFMIASDKPVVLGNVSPSQRAAGIARRLPGGDPSFIVVPPIEQFRSSYVFLTPDKYAFDFVRVIAPPDATVIFDGRPLEDLAGCEMTPADGLDASERDGGAPPFVVYRCQLSFPVIDPATDEISDAGQQNDGVHRIDSDRKVGVLVDGFDAFVSYGYAAGTELVDISQPR